MAMRGQEKDYKPMLGLIFAAFATVISMGSIAYAAGTLGQKVHDIEVRQDKEEDAQLPVRLARIETKIDILIDKETKK